MQHNQDGATSDLKDGLDLWPALTRVLTFTLGVWYKAPAKPFVVVRHCCRSLLGWMDCIRMAGNVVITVVVRLSVGEKFSAVSCCLGGEEVGSNISA